MAWTVSGGKWIPYKHLMYLSDRLVDVAAGRIDRLMVSMPPQHGKSELISKFFPAWYLGLNPDNKVILSSYEADFAASWGRKARTILEETGRALFGVEVSNISHAANRWEVAGHEGAMYTAGVGGPITGKTGNVLIIDDPVKNSDDAMSKAIRDSQYDWYQTTMSTRLADHGAIILVMTRWHQDDLAGRLLQKMKEGGEGWVEINLPALAGPSDVLGREEGDPLCPELKSLEFLNRAKGRMSNFWWSAMYQGNPVPEEGQIFSPDWWKYYDKPFTEETAKKLDDVIFSADCSFKNLDSSDYVAIGVWGRKGSKIYLIDQIRKRLGFWQTIDALADLRTKWPMVNGIYIEDKANGTAVIETLRQKVPGIVAVDPKGGKASRAAAASPYFKSGSVFLPSPSWCDWIRTYTLEHEEFPTGAHDDQVDQTTQALLVIAPYAKDEVIEPEMTEEEKWKATIAKVAKNYGGPIGATEKPNGFWE